MALPSYAVVMPVRDEARHLPRTARAMAAQTHPPERWVIVDDGSTDGTREIAEALAAEHDWIRVVATGRTDGRGRGAPIVRAFQAGRAALDGRPDFVVKMDADLVIPAHCFEWIARTFERVPRAGIVGGTTLIWDGEIWTRDRIAQHQVDGPLKSYRIECLEEIGGLRESMGWDGIDEFAARARGWQVHPLSELTLLHLVQRGAKQPWVRARWEEGNGMHYMGYLWSWAAARVAYRMLFESPFLLGGATIALGFAWARLTRRPVVDDASARAELRAEQRRRLRGLLTRRGAIRPAELPGGGPAFWDD